MKKLLALLAVAVCVAIATPCYGGNLVKGNPKTIDTLSYCTGATVGLAIKEDKILAVMDLDVKAFSKGFSDYLLGTAKVTYDYAAELLMHFVEEVAAGRLIKFAAEQAVNPNAKLKLYESEDERKNISYIFGAFSAEEVKNLCLESPVDFQCCWIEKGIQDGFTKKYIMTEVQMLEFLGRADIRLQQLQKSR